MLVSVQSKYNKTLQVEQLWFCKNIYKLIHLLQQIQHSKLYKKYSTTALKSVPECYGKSRLSSGEKSRNPGGHRSLYIGSHPNTLL
jgi:hypothetical protein